MGKSIRMSRSAFRGAIRVSPLWMLFGTIVLTQSLCAGTAAAVSGVIEGLSTSGLDTSSIQEGVPGGNPGATSGGWVQLDQRIGQGEQCLVCDHRIFDKGVIEIRYQGRTFFVASGEMLRKFAADPDYYFSKIQSRAALFDENSVGRGQMSLGWLGFGLYVLLGLVIGAACAYVAVTKGLSPVAWFFAGLFGNGAVLAVLLNTSPNKDGQAPTGIPAGLRKVPTTYGPATCDACGVSNHPSASACSQCGAALQPAVEPETARVS